MRYEQDMRRAAASACGTSPTSFPAGEPRVSDQAFVTGSVDLFDRRVTLRLTADAALGGRDDSIDYPARTLLGVDWHLRDDVDLFTEWEHAAAMRCAPT